MPVYKITSPSGERLVDAASKSAAIKHVVGDTFVAESVTTSKLVDLMNKGMVVESASVAKEPEVEAAEEGDDLVEASDSEGE